MMYKAIGAVSSLLLVCVCVLAIAADAPQAKQVDAPKKKENKAKAPAGYEDAPQAGNPPPRNAIRAPIVRAMEAVAVEDVPADFEQLLAINVDANVANREKQCLPQFTPLLTAELSFINRVCDLDLQQRRKIKAASDLCLKGAVRKYAMGQQGMMRHGMNRGNQTMLDPTELLHEALAKVLGETLQAEQQTAYDSELAKRKAYRQHVAVENVIAMIDERLVLATDQREKLTQSLVENWQPHWVQSIEMLIITNQYLPSIPDQFVVPALNETQKKVWHAAQKQNYAKLGAFAWGQQGAAVDDFPLDENEVDVEEAAN